MTKKQVIQLAKLLKVKPEKVIHFLKVPLGKKVNQGDVLAEKKKFLFKKRITSPIAGYLQKLDLDTGELIISDQPNEESELVKKVKSSKKSTQQKMTVFFSWGPSSLSGELTVVKQTLGLKDLKVQDCQDKVILAEAGIDEPGVVFKAEVLGAAGLIVISSSVDREVWSAVAEASDLAVVFVNQKAKDELISMKGKRVNIKAKDGEIDVN
jgi:hypothetical protein